MTETATEPPVTSSRNLSRRVRKTPKSMRKKSTPSVAFIQKLKIFIGIAAAAGLIILVILIPALGLKKNA